MHSIPHSVRVLRTNVSIKEYELPTQRVITRPSLPYSSSSSSSRSRSRSSINNIASSRSLFRNVNKARGVKAKAEVSKPRPRT